MVQNIIDGVKISMLGQEEGIIQSELCSETYAHTNLGHNSNLKQICCTIVCPKGAWDWIACGLIEIVTFKLTELRKHRRQHVGPKEWIYVSFNCANSCHWECSWAPTQHSLDKSRQGPGIKFMAQRHDRALVAWPKPKVHINIHIPNISIMFSLKFYFI